ncbi:MAG: alpha-2-macroglobulin family protein [Bacillota bacterium]
MKMKQTLIATVILIFIILGLSMLSRANNDLTPEEIKTKWERITELEKKQQYNAAVPLVEEILHYAQKGKDSPLWAKALIKRAVLELALHGYENTARILSDGEWPSGIKEQALLHMFSANVLFQYYQAYGWEINQREKNAGPLSKDIKTWTGPDIFEAINGHYGKAWIYRDLLGGEKTADYPEYLREGNYPDEIRKTMRDFLIYNWVEFLRNTQTWKPGELRGVCRLDLPGLLHVTPETTRDAVLKGNDTHPLQKIKFLLDEHHAWLATNNQKEGRLEVVLVKLQCAAPHFIKKTERLTIEAAYQKTLAEYRNAPWWSHGCYQYASYVRDGGDPARAHDLAAEGARAYPDSIGGKECAYLVKSIEAPSFSMRIMSNDKPGERSVLISHANMKRLYLRAYRLESNPERWPGRVPYMEGNENYTALIGARKPDYSWESPLEDPGDYHTHDTYLTTPIPAGKKGLYLLAASADKKFAKNRNQILAGIMCLSDLSIITGFNPSKNELAVWVRDGASGNAVSGAKARFFQYSYNRKYKSREAVTDLNGLASFTLEPDYYYGQYIVVQAAGQTAYHFSPYAYYRNPAAEEMQGIFIYTDRSIYRPLQKVYYKAVAYHGRPEPDRFQATQHSRIIVELLDPNREVIASQEVTTNNFGSASGEFTIPAGRLLGRYAIRTNNGGETPIRVEEYKRPTFETKLLPPEKPLRLNKPAVIKGEAVYYFGMPVSGGEVAYRVTRRPSYPWWYGWIYHRYMPQKEEEIAAGKTLLSEDGTFILQFTPEADENMEDKSACYYFHVSATVTAEGGETRETDMSYRLGFTTLEASLQAPVNFFLPDERITFRAHLADLNGVDKAGSGKYEVYCVEMPHTTARASEVHKHSPLYKQSPGDSMRPRWEAPLSFNETVFSWANGAKIDAGEVKHGPDGNADISLGKLQPGLYRLVYETADAQGSVFQTRQEFIVAAENMPVCASQFLIAQKNQALVGEKLQIFMGTGFRAKQYVFEIWKGDKLHTREYGICDGCAKTPEINVTEDLRGGFSLRMYFMEDYQLYEAQAWVSVPFDNKMLDVSFSTFRDLLRPGQKETWVLKVKGPQKEKASAEILAYMYDRSLDYFTSHYYPSPASLYGPRGYRPEIISNTGEVYSYCITSAWYTLPDLPVLKPGGFRFFDNYPIGGLGGRYIDGLMTYAKVSGEASSQKRETLREAPAVADEEATPDSVQKQDDKPLRTDFSETAFFLPHLTSGADGSVVIEFTAPDSVTSWNVYVHAITEDLKFMTLQKQVETRKELMIRPYLPRFFREGDEAFLKVAVNNAGAEDMKGNATIEILDTDTGKSALADFGINPKNAVLKWAAKAGKETVLAWPVKAPFTVKTYSFRVTASTGQFSDGELRPVPVLPSRMHLVQSRFITLKDSQTRELMIEDMKLAGKDPSLQNEALVATVDGQMIYTVLRSLPYLVNYPYECIEQTMNRYLSVSIVSSLYRQYPALRKMAEKFSDRKTRLEPWQLDDPNRKLALEETPWLRQAKGGAMEESDLRNMFDARVIRANRAAALARLRKAQLPDGGFPWFEGGPSSDYITLYILYGFAKAQEFRDEAPKDMAQRAFRYVKNQCDRYYRANLKDDYALSYLCFLNYVLSCYPEDYYKDSFTADERADFLVKCFAHWREFSPYNKAFLALTLHRAKRTVDAKLLMESIMDSAVTKPDQGTFWAREDRSWLWYNDHIESHAFILRTLLEISPRDERIDGLALWLLLNKKMNQWKSTKATAEVIYSLTHYMKAKEALAVREEVSLNIGGAKHRFVFEPDEYTGAHNQVVIEGGKVVPEKMASVKVEKQGPGYMFASLTWHYSTEKLPAAGKGDILSVQREYFIRRREGREYILIPLKNGADLRVGDQVEVHLSLTCRNPMEYVHLHDPRAGGLEPERPVSGHRWNLGICWYEEVRDAGTNFFFERLPQGEYTFKYRLRANMAGKFRTGPATAQSMYAPEFAAFSAGEMIRIGN